MSARNQDMPQTQRALFEAVVDGHASDEQRRQLETLLLGDEQARDAWLDYVNVHAALRRWFLSDDAGEPSERELAEFAEWAAREQMAQTVAAQTRARWLPPLVAVVLLLAAGLALSTMLSPKLRSILFSPAAAGPTVAQVDGDVQVESADGTTSAASDGRSLGPGDRVTVRGEHASVALRYADGTRIVLLGGSEAAIAKGRGDAKQLRLTEGMLHADVAAQPDDAPMTIDTPQARVRVLGTRFDLVAHARDGTRLDLESGRVELVRGDERPVPVSPQSTAIIPSTSDPIRVSPLPRTVTRPDRETVYRGLKSAALLDDGETVIAATRWQAMYWGPDERLELVPLNGGGSNGISLRRQAGSLLAYFDESQQKLVVWDAERRRAGWSFDQIAELKRQFQDHQKRPAGWNPTSSLAVVSPRGQWLAFQIGREFRLWGPAPGLHWPQFARRYDGKFVGALAASPDGKMLAVAVRRGRVDLVDIGSGDVTATWSLKHEVPFAMEFSPDGARLAVGLAGHVAVHDTAGGEQLADFPQPGLPFLHVAISHDGRIVAASSLGERVRVWDIDHQSELPSLNIGEPVRDLAFTPGDDRLVVVSGEGRLTIWNLAPRAAGASSTD